MARRRNKLPVEPVEAAIESLAQDGRGVTHIDGKAVFVDGALAGERVRFVYTRKARRHDEGRVETVLESSPDRVTPHCPHFGICGACSLQHLDTMAQIEAKQQSMLDALQHIGGVQPEHVLAPLTADPWGYRRKARLGVRYVRKKGKVLVGFREKRANYLAELESCAVLHPSVGERLLDLAALIEGMAAREQIAQIEVAVGDNATQLVFRNLVELDEADRDRLIEFARATGFFVSLQPGGPETVTPLYPDAQPLYYEHPEFDVRVDFQALDFTQVNAGINRKMVPYALELLDVQPDDVVLDLFAGLGNFTLPLARRAARVVGVEGDEVMVQRAKANALANGIDNTEYHAADLMGEMTGAPWLKQGYDKILLDPPRLGAQEVLAHIGKLGARRIVYVSCHPGTLARDAGLLVKEHGYRLVSAGVMDMFPHTAHVESIALFVKD
jgi:23S rRNA (uracil1939-C5)-methyltransferase